MTRSPSISMIFKVSLTLGLLLAALPLWAQDDSQDLPRARERFDNGKFYQAINIVQKKVLSYKPKKVEKAGAYRLLTEIYLTLGENDSADVYMKKYLKHARGLQMDASNPDLYHEYRTFRTDPILFLSPKLGLNTTQIIPYQKLGPGNTLDPPTTYQYIPTYLSLNGGLGLSLAISKKVELGLEVLLIDRQYKYEEELNFSARLAGNTSMREDTSVHSLSLTEGHLWLDVPLWLSYTYRRKYIPNHPQKIFPYFNAGLTYSYLLKAEFEVIRRVSQRPEGTPVFIAENRALSLLNPALRNRHSLTVSAGGGFKFKVGTNYLGLDFRYNLGFINLVNTQNRNANETLIYTYGHVDDDMRMNQYALSLSYVIPIYNYKKKRAYKKPVITDKPVLANRITGDDQVVYFESVTEKEEEGIQYEIVWENDREVLAYSDENFRSWDSARYHFPAYANFKWQDEGNYTFQRENGVYYIILLDSKDRPLARSEKTFVDLYEAHQERDRLRNISAVMPKNVDLVVEPRQYAISLLDGKKKKIGQYEKTFKSLRMAESTKASLASLNPVNTDLTKEINVYQVSLKTNLANERLSFIPTFATTLNARGFIAKQVQELGLPKENFRIDTLKEKFEIIIRDGDINEDGGGHDLITIHERFELEARARERLAQLRRETVKADGRIQLWRLKSDRLKVDTLAQVYKVYLRDAVGDSIALFKKTFPNEKSARDFMNELSVYHLEVRQVDMNRPVRNPTPSELEGAAITWIGKEVNKYLARQPKEEDIVKAEEGLANLIQVINKELDRLQTEKKNLNQSLRKGQLKHIEEDMDTLQEWKKKLKERKRDLRRDTSNP